MKEKKTANYIRLQKGSGQGEKKGKNKRYNKRKKEIQMRWMQSPSSTTDGSEKRKKKRKKGDTDALDAVATKHHRRFGKPKGIGLDTHSQKSV